MSHLWTIDIQSKATQSLTSGAFTVGNFAWSPDGKSIAFDHKQNSTPAASRLHRHLHRHRRGRNDPQARHAGRTRRKSGVVTRRIADRIRVGHGEPGLLLHEQRDRRRARERRHADGADGRVRRGPVHRRSGPADGLFFAAMERTYAYLYRLDPATEGGGENASAADRTVNSSFSVLL